MEAKKNIFIIEIRNLDQQLNIKISVFINKSAVPKYN